MASTQSAFAGTIPAPKVRVVAKIRGFSDPDTSFEPSRTVDWVSVSTEISGEVTISFKEQSSSRDLGFLKYAVFVLFVISRYSVDYCYNEHEDNEVIYSKEVKPLVSAAFEGINSTVIVHGARGSGKTQLIQGSLEKPGLAMLAISEFLLVTEKNGKSIAVSFYEKLELILSILDHDPPMQIQGSLVLPMKTLISDQLLRHADEDVKISVTACLTQITRITAPDAPYDDELMKEFLKLAVSAFEKLSHVSGRSYEKAISILENFSKIKMFLIMLDLECDDLVMEMFQQFLRIISTDSNTDTRHMPLTLTFQKL
ncbi:hypothetical protein RYX36_021968 [Vicia faba]